MSTKYEIEAKYLTIHKALGTRKDAVDKDLFDQQHQQVWRDCETELKVRKVGLQAKPTLLKDEQVELSELKMQFPDPRPAPRDLAAEIDDLKQKVKDIGDSPDLPQSIKDIIKR